MGNESWNRYVFRRLQKTGSVGAEVTSCGKLFQSLLPATGNARSPIVTSRVGRTVSRSDGRASSTMLCIKQFHILVNYTCFSHV